MPKLNVQSKAINTAMPPNKLWLGSVERTKKEKAIPQQPSTTIPGRIRLCGPRTPGERIERLLGVIPGFALFFCAGKGGALCVLLLTGPFLYLVALGITLISPHFVSLRDSLCSCLLLFVVD